MNAFFTVESNENDFEKVKKELEIKMKEHGINGVHEDYDLWKEYNESYDELLLSQNRDNMKVFINAIRMRNASIENLMSMAAKA
jgi:hypothetical protein